MLGIQSAGGNRTWGGGGGKVTVVVIVTVAAATLPEKCGDDATAFGSLSGGMSDEALMDAVPVALAGDNTHLFVQCGATVTAAFELRELTWLL